MNAKRPTVVRFLVIFWVLVLFIVYSEGIARASYNNSTTELEVADDAEEILAELEYVLGMLEEVGRDKDKQFDLTPIFFTYNIC